MKKSAFAAVAIFALLGLGSAAQAGAPGPAPVQTARNPGDKPAMLDPDKLAKPRPKAPFDVTGVWQLDNARSENGFRDRPSNQPTPATQKMLDEAKEFAAKNLPYNDDTGQCWPTGLPRIMTRVWPIQMIQLPTGITMVFAFMNEARWIYTDGREHGDPDLLTSTWNGETVGKWEGNALVATTFSFQGKHHWMDEAIPVGENARLTERITMPDPNLIQIDQTWTDPDHWVGEYKNKKVYRRQWGVDVVENHCLPDTNSHIAAARDAVK